MKLVYVNNNRPITDSLIVADSFGKEHRRVMQDIRELGCSEQFRLHHFVHTPYVNEQNGQTYEKCLMTEQGFAILAFGYTGQKAMNFKEDFINEFERMKSELINPSHALPQNYKEALLALVGQVEKTELLEAKIEADRPKLVLAESLEVSKDSILIGQLAKILKQNNIDIGQNRLFEILRKDGYLMKQGSSYNAPSQKSMDLKIMEIKIGSRISLTEGSKVTQTTKITGKGIQYFINKFKSPAVSA